MHVQSLTIWTILSCLNKKVWNKFPTTLSIAATITRKAIIKIKSCFEHLFGMLSSLYHLHHIVNTKSINDSPAFKVLQKIGDKIRFSPDFAKNGGRLNENFSQDTIFLAKTLSLDLHTCSKLVTLWVNGIKPVHPVHQGSNKHTQP